jgi:hypothetical protein
MKFLTLKPTDLENQGWIFYPAQIFSQFNDPKYNLQEKLTLALENVKMENWGAWLNVSQSIIVSKAEQHIFMRDFHQFQSTKEGADNTHHSLNDTHAIYAKITFKLFDKGGRDYDHIITAEFYTK